MSRHNKESNATISKFVTFSRIFHNRSLRMSQNTPFTITFIKTLLPDSLCLLAIGAMGEDKTKWKLPFMKSICFFYNFTSLLLQG
jgi:hypothetical protein